ncbi:MAG: protein translocase subunit SecF [Pseudomonadota bacterium]|nr:protein translocase subunit SecF [Pseudomonadota bacterium]|tara:strand:+ start:745 stop:1653 length:909 start_codon:yes stop_codon:yes gene_type:complete
MHIDFMRFRKILLLVSAFLFVGALISITLRGFNLGLDFSGGSLVEIKYPEPVALETIRSVLEESGFEDYQVVNFGSNLDVLIKIAEQSAGSSVGDEVFNTLTAAGLNGELQRNEFVGPQIGSELRDQGGLGMLVALGMILLYVAFRFQYKFALGAVGALGHDVVIILGLFSFFRWDFDLSVLAALLAVIGYSLNDSIVVSDRIRENFRSERALSSIELLNLSLNQTLSRTIITSLTTLLVLFALFFFGGETVKGFSLGLIIGVVIGTYSSLYIVTSILIQLGLSQDDMVVPEVEGADFDDMP